MPQHAVDPVDRFAYILHYQNRAIEVRRERRSEKRGDEREITADDATPRAAVPQHAPVIHVATGVFLIDERAAERLPRELGQPRTRCGTVKRYQPALPVDC